MYVFLQKGRQTDPVSRPVAARSARPLGPASFAARYPAAAAASKSRALEAELAARWGTIASIERCNSSARVRTKTHVALFCCCRGRCIPLWAVFPPLQVVFSSACSVASLSQCPNHYLPGHIHLHERALADFLFGWGNPSTWHAGYAVLHNAL